MSEEQRESKVFDSDFFLGLAVILVVIGVIIYGATRPTPSADESRSPSPVAPMSSESPAPAPTPADEETTAAQSEAPAANDVPSEVPTVVGERPALSVNSALVACEREVLNRTGVSVKSKYQTGIIGEELTDEYLFVKVTVEAKSGRDEAQLVMECWATGSDEDPRVVNVDVY